MKSIISLFVASLLLAGCAANDYETLPLRSTDKLVPQGDQAIVVVGLSVLNPRVTIIHARYPIWGGWIAFDKSTKQRVGKANIAFSEDCSGIGIVARASNACDGVQYHVYVIEPGSYALAWAYTSRSFYELLPFKEAHWSYGAGDANLSKYSLSDEALVRPTSIMFDARPGEVVYVGNVMLDFADNVLRSSIAVGNEEEARKSIPDAAASQRMVIRTLRRADGKPITASDAVPANK